MENEIVHLSKDSLLPVLQARIEELDKVVKLLVKRQKAAPTGMLGISSHQGKFQLFHVDSGTSAKGKFITKDNLSLARSLAQRDYEKKTLVLLKRQSQELNRCVNKYCVDELEQLWGALHPARHDLVEPIALTDEEYRVRWLAVEYNTKEFDPESPVLLTAGGERVRSKSEVIIADTLRRFGVPYRYEFSYEMKCGNRRMKVHPDFTCLNSRCRREFIWEHFGLVDDLEYAENMVKKLNTYRDNGFVMGKNLLLTMETRNNPLSSKDVECVVKDFLL